MARPEVIGHRGLPRQHLENTLPSFSAALALGVDGLELDVHQTSDGVVVVNHDPTVGDGPQRPIASVPMATVRAVAPHVPTLDEVLELVGERARVYVEIKAPRIGPGVVASVRRHPASWCSIHSFHHPTILEARRVAPEVSGGVGLFGYPVDPGAVLRDADASHFWVSHELIDADMVRAVHHVGARVMAWTVNDIDRAQQLAEMGVDGLCTDRSDLFVPRFRDWST